MERFGSVISVGDPWQSINFTHQPLNVTMIHDPPFTYVEENASGAISQRGYLVDLWKIVAEELQLRYTLQPPPRGGYGALLENGTWSGIIGQLDAKRADVGLGWFTYREDRAAVVDFADLVPVFTGDLQFLVRRGARTTPRLSSEMFDSLLRPLHSSVWLVLLLSLLVLAAVLSTTVALNRRRAESDETCREFGLGSSALAAFMAVTGQGWAVTPDSLAARIATMSAWMMSILVSTTYTANLISHLTVGEPEMPITSLAEFRASSDWTLAVEFGVGAMGDWAKSSDPNLYHLYQRAVTGDRYLAMGGNEDNIRRAAGPKTLMYYNREIAFSVIGRETCELLPLEPDTDHRGVRNYLVLRKGIRPLKKAMDRVLQRLMQAGTLDHLKRRWFGVADQQCSDDVTFRPLTLADLLAVLVITPLAAARARSEPSVGYGARRAATGTAYLAWERRDGQWYR
ncbi:glutamate receptor-like [Amphibalanus amphitrite]|uniref:glutamate receptor-like n=1 Tax=Amphibalanus amphitrite TaxID=1232801 RepID=UPI001C914413|nr:glutamate receptor-like [Amphibalanus amphitrite]